MEEGEQSSSMKRSPSNPNMDLIDTNEMPNLKTSMEEIGKTVDRKNRPASRQFGSNATVVKRSPTKVKVEALKEEEAARETTPVVRKELLKDHSIESGEKKGPIVLSSPEKKSIKEMANGFFHLPFKTRKSTKEDESPSASREELQGELFGSGPGSTGSINLATSNSTSSATSPPSDSDAETKSKGLVQTPSSGSAFKELTGYRSSKMALSNSEDKAPTANFTGYRSSRMTMTMSPVDANISNTISSHTTYNAMSNLRQSRMSGMFGPNSASGHEKPDAAQNSKTFKQYYRTLLEEHDVGQRDNMAINRRPKVFKLSAMFGLRGERTDPMQRLMWMSSYYESIKTDDAFTARPADPAQATISKKPDAPRILDVDLNSSPSGIELDSSQALGLELVVAGTEKGLLDRLMVPLHQDLSYPEVFLASYRFFISPMQVFQHLSEWYNVSADGSIIPNAQEIVHENKKAIQVRSLRIMLLWIRNHWQDFLDNHGLWSQLRNFSKYLSNESFPDFQKIMHAIREERLSWMTTQYIPMFPGMIERDSTAFWCAEVDTDKFAHDLTMLDHIFFRQIKPDLYFQMLAKPGTLLNGAFNIPLKGLFDYCNWFRMVASYPSALLAIQENTKKRTMTIRLLIKIAKICLDLGNLNGAFCIIFGLKQPAALIWYSAWEALPAKSMDYFKAINRLMSCGDGYKNYWDYTQKLQPPAVPFLVPYLHDIVFLLENTPLLKGDTLLDLPKEEKSEDQGSKDADLGTSDPKKEGQEKEKIVIKTEETPKENSTSEDVKAPSILQDSKSAAEAGLAAVKEDEEVTSDKFIPKPSASESTNSEQPRPSQIQRPSQTKRQTKTRDSVVHSKLLESKLFANRSVMMDAKTASVASDILKEEEKKINFQKFYDIFSVAAELERYRRSSYHKILVSGKTSSCTLLQHIRFMSKRDDSSIGTLVTFNSGMLPDDNPVLNSEAAIKNIKKIVNLLAGVE